SQTGDTRGLQKISTEKCEGCRAYIDLYRKTYEAGGFFRGSIWELSSIRVKRGDRESLVLAHVDAPQGTYRKARNAKLKHGNSEDSELAFGAKYSSGAWRMTQLGLASEIVE
ncbi:DUF6318 family protein, partial [Aeromicrobium sp.]|uniref:DUF6318 family protein n=1 Tax=Aeromicrobium sp. TaxID=1871063 RepID=UPI003C4146FA